MKFYFPLMLFISQLGAAQDIALLDRALKNPVAVTQKVTILQLSGKLFPIYAADLDSVIRVTETLAHNIGIGELQQSDMRLLTAGHSQFAVISQRNGIYNNYTISLSTRTGDMGASLDLVKRGDNNKKAARQLQAFLDYMKNNRHIVKTKK